MWRKAGVFELEARDPVRSVIQVEACWIVSKVLRVRVRADLCACAERIRCTCRLPLLRVDVHGILIMLRDTKKMIINLLENTAIDGASW